MDTKQRLDRLRQWRWGRSKGSFLDQDHDQDVIPASSQSLWRISWRAFRHNPTGMLGLAGVFFVIMMTILAPWVAPYDPLTFDLDHRMEGPSDIHFWGTDDLGRDVLSRVLWGGRQSLGVAVMAIVLALGGGTVFGLISGFYGGWVDSTTQRLVEVFMAFPSLLLVLSVVAILGAGLPSVLFALGIASIPGYTRLVRASVLSARNMDYVIAARAVGASNRRIMFRHIMPNIIAPIIVYSTLGVGGAIMVTAGLSYIGLGATPPAPEWGAMLNYGRNYLRNAWWMSVFPGLIIFFIVMSVNLMGDALRDALDPKLRV